MSMEQSGMRMSALQALFVIMEEYQWFKFVRAKAKIKSKS